MSLDVFSFLAEVVSVTASYEETVTKTWKGCILILVGWLTGIPAPRCCLGSDVIKVRPQQRGKIAQTKHI